MGSYGCVLSKCVMKSLAAHSNEALCTDWLTRPATSADGVVCWPAANEKSWETPALPHANGIAAFARGVIGEVDRVTLG